ncbi:Ribosomal protein s17 [Colletotrichum higginsianum IMI 349063]|uniref:Ribosomal protein s17 n=3 Tax=Colletotrichum higginsianum TaxID=80884 RepID=A0A1B7XRN5_COLHI|nr:Ribosomal protein s17 [Colletotrichum higginsianum IMI 349063]OBR02419.1 Ribosomal protein s17 [Colletotrichum higginsianum IMI 349063]TID07571.1 hypothetical protein CH35J_000174 [Colletotrichum higginsianum]
MKFQTPTVLAALVALAAAEVPQEHSHEKYLRAVNALLKQDNPNNIVDAVFGLLGNAAAADGAGDVTNLDCLHQVTADSAFSAAKAAGDVDGMASALVFRAVERNTGAVGLKSVLCDETAVNPEIAALTQHQDPASENAAEENKAITLELARQLAAVGADPQLALDSGTFAPGDVNDATGAGNTCDDADDAEGCIFTQGLLVQDATPEEIDAAVAEGAGGAGGNAGNAGGDAAADDGAAACPAGNATESAANSTSATTRLRARVRRSTPVARSPLSKAVLSQRGATATVRRQNNNGTADAGDDADNADNNAGNDAATGTTNNVQTFTGDLGGPAPPVSSSASSDKPFEVNGATFLNAGAALQRSCAVQHNACADAANSGAEDVSVADCDAQEDSCLAAASLKKLRRASGLNAGGRRMRIAASGLVRGRQAFDFGECADPSIQFAEGLDGRAEASFGPAGDFDHGSAQNINIISGFICGQLGSRCQADEAAVAACEQGQADAQGLEGQEAADAFNSALGL